MINNSELYRNEGPAHISPDSNVLIVGPGLCGGYRDILENWGQKYLKRVLPQDAHVPFLLDHLKEGSLTLLDQHPDSEAVQCFNHIGFLKKNLEKIENVCSIHYITADLSKPNHVLKNYSETNAPNLYDVIIDHNSWKWILLPKEIKSRELFEVYSQYLSNKGKLFLFSMEENPNKKRIQNIHKRHVSTLKKIYGNVKEINVNSRFIINNEQIIEKYQTGVYKFRVFEEPNIIKQFYRMKKLLISKKLQA